MSNLKTEIEMADETLYDTVSDLLSLKLVLITER